MRSLNFWLASLGKPALFEASHASPAHRAGRGRADKPEFVDMISDATRKTVAGVLPRVIEPEVKETSRLWSPAGAIAAMADGNADALEDQGVGMKDWD